MRWRHIGKPVFRLVVCIAAVFAVTAVLYAVPPRDRALAAALSFLFVVLIVSAVWGFRYALFVSLLAALGFSWLLPPVGRFWLSNPRDVFVLAAFLVIGIIASRFSDRARREALATAALAIGVFIFDTTTSPEIAAAVLYVAVVLMAARFLRARGVLLVALGCVGLTVWGYFLTPPIGPAYPGIMNTSLAIVAIALTTFLVLRSQAAEVALREQAVLMAGQRAEQRSEAALREQASLLNLTHDAIFVRDTNHTISYWNRAAEEMYGWTAEEAFGNVSHRLLKTVFPVPLEQIEAELMRAGRWEGELVRTKKDGTPVVVASRWSLQQNQGTPIAILETNNDVTEQKRAEQARQEIEEQWRAAFESNPTMYFIVDAAGAIASVNGFGAEQLGYTVSELVGQPVLSVFDEPDRQAVQRHANACFEQPGRMMRWEARKIRKDGTMLWVRETAKVVVLKKRPVLLVVCEDITEQKRAEETLRQTEYYLTEGERLTQTGSYAWHAASGLVHVSAELKRIFGFDPEQRAPLHAAFRERVHPDDLAMFDALTERTTREGADLDWLYRIVLPDGTLKYLHVVARPVLSASGEVVGNVGTTRDITERKRVEEEVRTAETRFRASVDHLTDALFIHDDQDDQGRVIDVNQQACDSLGYTREELIGMTAFDYDALVDATFMRSIKERVAGGENFSFESAHRRKDGSVFPVEVRVRPFWHGDHRFGLALARDITDRKHAEQERERLHQLEADLAHLNRVSMMGELAASLAHEIKQPIAAAVTNGDACLRLLDRDQPDVAEAREAALEMSRDARRAANIIDRVRSLYGKGSSQQEIVDVNEVIGEMVAMLHNEANRCSVAIHASLAASLPKVTADRVQLQQVLMNLMLNGIEAMRETTGELTIKSELADNNQLLISVTDNGVGLPAEKVDQIFNAFFTTKPQGTGLGLAISRSIVESHGGRLWASANSERGATFQFTLPNKMAAHA
jgi:PAS domain S-box-containing protein